MSYLYAVQMLIPGHPFHPVKVGFSADPDTRLSKHYSGGPYPVEILGVWEGALEDEKRFHKRYKAHRLQGEWFNPTQELMAEIQSCIDAADPYEFDPSDPDWENNLSAEQARCLERLREDQMRLETDTEYRREQFRKAAAVMGSMLASGTVSQEFADECRSRVGLG